jgi:hypothetical protein
MSPESAAIPCAFRPEFLDFDRGLHVGNLEEHERITRVLKQALETRYGQSFVTERWGRGVYWQWIGYLPRADRAAKPVSSGVSFGCSKFFLAIDREERIFQCGLQIERGYIRAPRGARMFQLRQDWDWNRLLAALKPRSQMEREITRLLGDGFRLHAGTWGGESFDHTHEDFPGARKLRRELEAAAPNYWAGFQLYFPMSEKEVRASTGLDLVESILAVFDEVVPVMNPTMQIRLKAGAGRVRLVEPPR